MNLPLEQVGTRPLSHMGTLKHRTHRKPRLPWGRDGEMGSPGNKVGTGWGAAFHWALLRTKWGIGFSWRWDGRLSLHGFSVPALGKETPSIWSFPIPQEILISTSQSLLVVTAYPMDQSFLLTVGEELLGCRGSGQQIGLWDAVSADEFYNPRASEKPLGGVRDNVWMDMEGEVGKLEVGQL